MDTKSPTSDIVDLVTFRPSSRDRDKLTDPSRDPARKLLELSDDEIIPSTKPRQAIPSVEDITAALTDHVFGGPVPYKLIVDLLSPFCDENTHIILEPGKGLKHPTYSVRIPHLNLSFGRSAPRAVALKLHFLAEKLAAFDIGDRAPENAPEFIVNVKGLSRHIDQIAVKAANTDTLLRACAMVFGYFHTPIHAPLEMSQTDLLKHVLVARDILAQNEFETSDFRQQAADLISAVQDLRMAATVAMRLNPFTSRDETYAIEINPFDTPMVNISQSTKDTLSSHEKIAFISQNKAVFDALTETIPFHSVLQKLPETFSIHLVGEVDFLSMSIQDSSQPVTSPEHKISSRYFCYKSLDDLAERLARSASQQSNDIAHWRLQLSGRICSSYGWDLSGKTLSHAFANIAKSEKRSSTVLTDLAIDLSGDAYGAPINFNLHRIIYSK